MFNPKINNLLDEQLTTSGRQMTIDPISTTLAVVSAGSSIIGGISGANKAKENERAAKEEAKRAQKMAEDEAKRKNKYNKKKWKADKQNFLDNRQYNYEQAMRQYEYATQVQQLEYETQMRAYAKDQENLQKQLAFNKIGARQAYMKEQNIMRDITDEQSFDRMDAYIEGMKSRGAAAVSPAGKSGDRAVHMALAEKGRQLAVMDASFRGAVRQHNINMFDISLNKYGADMNAHANTMLEPSAPIDLIKPQITPMPKFTKPYKIEPEFVSQYVPESDTLGTIMGGISNAASALSSIDFTNPSKTTAPPPTRSGDGQKPAGPGGGSHGEKPAGTMFSGNPFSPG